MKRFNRLIANGVRNEYSDLHITGDHAVVFRKHGKISFLNKEVYTPEEVDDLVGQLLTPRQKRILGNRWSVDFARTIQRIRVRINVFNTSRGLSIAARFLPGTIPTIASLNLHPSLQDFCKLRSGLLLICGPTGSGKSTTIAAMIDAVNRNRTEHVITLEDPIEYRYRSIRCFVEQRELGQHFPSFERGLLDVLREDPDVIVVGEMREPEVMRLTLNAAESGHLVIASMHASTPEEAVFRICNSFPMESQDMVRHQIASCIQAIVVQYLEYHERAGFRVPLLSIMTGSVAARGSIRESTKLTQLQSVIEMGRGEGMFTFERYRQEYLAGRSDFTPPSINFRPSPESVEEKTYASKFINEDGGVTYYAPSLASPPDARPDAPRPPQQPSARPPEEGREGQTYLSINDSASIEEIIRQMQESGGGKI